jgi:hypothetical protein
MLLLPWGPDRSWSSVDLLLALATAEDEGPSEPKRRKAPDLNEKLLIFKFIKDLNDKCKILIVIF